MGRLLGEVAARIRGGRPWGQTATRLAILEAARRIVACDGVQAVTLSRAADEAGFARPTVYGHFRNKDELLVSIIADDLATLGRLMRRGAVVPSAEAPVEEEQPHAILERSENLLGSEEIELPPEEAAQVTDHYLAYAAEFPAEECAPAANDSEAEVLELEPADEIVEDEPVEQEASEPESVAEFSEPLLQETHEPVAEPAVEEPQLETAPEEPQIEAEFDAVPEELEDAEPQEEIAADAPQSKPEQIDNPRQERRASFTQPRVDAWLERRLRVFERTLAEVNARMDKAEQSAERAQGFVGEGMRDIQQTLDAAEQRQRQAIDGIIRRLEAADQRNLAAIANMRVEMHTALNPDAKIKTGEGADPVAEFVPQPVIEEPRPKREPSDSFISAARRAANAAAELAEAERSTSGPLMGGLKWSQDDDKRKLYTRYLISGVGILALTMIGAGLLLRQGADDVKALSPIPKMSSAHAETIPSSKLHAAAPLDRLTALANSGDAQAELIVGLTYMNGSGKGTNDASAAQWIARAANAHDPIAQYYLGTLYERGFGVEKDLAQAEHWYEAAAGQGNRKAMYRLGVAYAGGLGVQKDFAQSANWFTKAANAGLVDAQFNLAVLYERGQGVPQSLLDAYKWYAIAASHGDKESQSRVEALGAQLNPDDLAAAERSVQEFTPADYDRQANVAPTIADVAGP